MTIQVLAAGDTVSSRAASRYVVAAAAAHATFLGITYQVHPNVGDVQYDGGYQSEFVGTTGYDRADSYSQYNAIVMPVPGNHDTQNPIGAAHLARWTASAPLTTWTTASKLCFPATPLVSGGKGNNRWYLPAVIRVVASPQTGGSEPNWPTAYAAQNADGSINTSGVTFGGAMPAGFVQDGDVIWACVQPGRDYYRYFREQKSGGVYASYKGLDYPSSGSTRRSASPECDLLATIAKDTAGLPAYGKIGSGPVGNPNWEWYFYDVVDPADATNVWRFYALNSELEYGRFPSAGISPTSPQYIAFQKDITDPQHAAKPKVVYWHYPRHQVDFGGSGTGYATFDEVYRLAVNNGARLLLWGHQHAYNRFKPLKADGTAATSTLAFPPDVPSAICMIIGDGGNNLASGALDTANAGRLGVLGDGSPAADNLSYAAHHIELTKTSIRIRRVKGADAAGAQITYANATSVVDDVTYTLPGVVGPPPPPPPPPAAPYRNVLAWYMVDKGLNGIGFPGTPLQTYTDASKTQPYVGTPRLDTGYPGWDAVAQSDPSIDSISSDFFPYGIRPRPGTGINWGTDAFARTLSNQWGSTDDGLAWTRGDAGAASLANVTGAAGTLGPVSGSNASVGMLLPVANSTADIDQSAQTSVDKHALSQGHGVRIIARYVDESNYLAARLRVMVDDSVELCVMANVAGVISTWGVVVVGAAGSFVANQRWWLRFQVTGNTMQARAWRSGTTQPTTWQSVRTVAAGLPFTAAGRYGVRLFTSNGSTVSAMTGSWYQYDASGPSGVGSPDLRSTYSSKAFSDVDQQMQQMLAAGISTVVVRWRGLAVLGTRTWPLSREDSIMPLLLDRASANGLTVICALAPYGARSPAELTNDLTYLEAQYGWHPAWFQHPRGGLYQSQRGSGRPVYVIAGSGNATAWAAALDSARGATGAIILCDNAFTVAQMVTQKFDGMIADYMKPATDYDSSYNQYRRWIHSFPAAAVVIPSVMPGFSSNRGGAPTTPVIDRNNGVTFGDGTVKSQQGGVYDAQWEAILASSVYDVAISSWNDWADGSQIEQAAAASQDAHMGSFSTTTGSYLANPPYTYKDYGTGGTDYYLLRTANRVTAFLADKAPDVYATGLVKEQMGAPNASDGLYQIEQSATGRTEVATVGGRVARRGVNTGGTRFIFFGVTNSWVYDNTDPRLQVSITVSYFDTGTGNLVMQYDGIGGALISHPEVVPLANSLTWKTKKWVISDARFAGRVGSVGADFRLSIPATADVAIDVVSATKATVVSPPPPPPGGGTTLIALRVAPDHDDTVTSSLQFTVPAETQAGDVIVVCTEWGGVGVTPVWPAPWGQSFSRLVTVGSGTSGMTCEVRRIVATDAMAGQTYTITGTGTNTSLGAAVITLVFANVAVPPTPPVPNTGSGTTATVPSGGTLSQGSAIVAIVMSALTGSITAPNGAQPLDQWSMNSGATNEGTIETSLWATPAAGAQPTLSATVPSGSWAAFAVPLPVGNVVPVGGITSPTQGATITNPEAPTTVTASWSDPDGGIAKSEVRVNGGAWLVMSNVTGSTYTRDVLLTSAAGQSVPNTIEVRATDTSGGTTTSQITVTAQRGGVSPPPPPPPPGGTVFTKTEYLGVEAYAALHDRMMAMGLHYVEGVAPSPGATQAAALASLAVSQHAAGANWSVDIAIGWACVQGDDVVNQGMYIDFNNAAFNLVNTRGQPSSASRTDIAVARVNDSEHTTRTPADQMYFDWIYGTEGGGDPTIPPSALPLARAVIPTSATSITTAVLTDLRKLYGPGIWGENGRRYRLGIDVGGLAGVEQV